MHIGYSINLLVTFHTSATRTSIVDSHAFMHVCIVIRCGLRNVVTIDRARSFVGHRNVSLAKHAKSTSANEISVGPSPKSAIECIRTFEDVRVSLISGPCPGTRPDFDEIENRETPRDASS